MGRRCRLSFAYNYVSVSSGTTNFAGDLTGDGIQDVKGSAWATYLGPIADIRAFAGNGLLGRALGNILEVGSNSTEDGGSFRDLAAFSFQDSRINNGSRTYGFLDMTASEGPGTGGAKVQIHRLIFDDSSTTAPTGVTSETTGLTSVNATYGVTTGGGTSAVPEASTSLGLLALGAGGILTRRRQKRAA